MVESRYKISVCIPTYNREKYLPETIQGVLGQTYKDFELIICNDGSPDDTDGVIKRFSDDRIRYIKNKKNIGYINSMNRCTMESRGEWIMHLSDDDIMLPKMLEKMMSALNKVNEKKIGFIVPQSININSSGGVISIPKRQLKSKDYILFHKKEFIPNFTLYGEKIRGLYEFNTSFPSTLFNKKILMEMGMSSLDVPVSHDILIESKICLIYPVLVVDEPLFQYRVHENLGSSLNSSGTFLKEYRRFLSILLTFIKENSISFPYNFESYCHHALVKYLIRYDGGIVKMSLRYKGKYYKRLLCVFSYAGFCVNSDLRTLIDFRLYCSFLIGVLPQKVLLFLAMRFGKL